jgi:hypothetical protein
MIKKEKKDIFLKDDFEKYIDYYVKGNLNKIPNLDKFTEFIVNNPDVWNLIDEKENQYIKTSSPNYKIYNLRKKKYFSPEEYSIEDIVQIKIEMKDENNSIATYLHFKIPDFSYENLEKIQKISPTLYRCIYSALISKCKDLDERLKEDKKQYIKAIEKMNSFFSRIERNKRNELIKDIESLKKYYEKNKKNDSSIMFENVLTELKAIQNFDNELNYNSYINNENKPIFIKIDSRYLQ